MRREIHDGPHPQTAEASNKLGFVTDEYSESRAAVPRGARDEARAIGTDHPEIAIGLNNVAIALYQQRKYDAAQGFYESALEMQRRLLGKEHPDVAMTLNNLAFAVHDKGDLKTALELSHVSLETYMLALGAEHPSVARAKNNLAMWMMEASDFTQQKIAARRTGLRSSVSGPEQQTSPTR